MYTIIALLGALFINPKLVRVNTQIEDVTWKLKNSNINLEQCIAHQQNLTQLIQQRHHIILTAKPGEL